MNLFEISNLDTSKPRFNPLITENFVYHQIKNPIDIVRGHLQQISGSFGEHLKLLNVRMCEPLEEIGASYITSNKTGGPPRLKLDENHLYMCAIEFSYFDVKFPAYYIRLPYHLRGGKLIMDGRTFFNLPVLADRGVNIKGEDMYLPLNRTNTPVKTKPYYIRQNNLTIVDNILIAEFHEGAKKAKNKDKGIGRVNLKPTLFLYLLLKCGLTKAAKDYLGVEVEVVQGSYDQVVEKYSPLEYTIYSSLGAKPRGLHKDRWKYPDLHLVFKGEPTHQQSEIASNFFYIYDYFAIDLDKDDLDSTDIWMVIAGRIIFNFEGETYAKKAERVEDHLVRCIDILIDRETKKELLIDNIIVEDSYDLFAWFIKNEKESFVNATSNSFDNKRLASSRYTLAPIANAITRLSYELDNFKKNDTPPTVDKMKRTLKRYLHEGLLRELRSKNNEVMSIQAPTDSIWLNITRNVVPQIKAKATRSRGGMLMHKSENLIHPTVLVCAKADSIPKSDPTRKSSINPFMRVDSNGVLDYDHKYDPIMKQLSKMYRYDYGFKDEGDIQDFSFTASEE